ncbi:Cadmium/zinc-transporting ATPase HMA2 [Platanthera guangdongensis]|uniref:Cadmium/zinc-transporting ATPase HMA2 n=1 Tax=Platanthera guangdongensis TaxID=2320717 RepID=A0ABR2MWQ4_9ASPA
MSGTEICVEDCREEYAGVEEDAETCFNQRPASKKMPKPASNTKDLIRAVVVIAAGVALFPLVLKAQNMRHWLKLALVLLVSACPCALVLSTPVATFCSFLTAAKIGLLVKGGDVLEALGKTKLVAFDKTGTITRGEFSVREMKPLSSAVDKHTLLLWISSLESKSSHPMATALVEYARFNSIEPKPDSVSAFHIYPGEGVSGEINGEKIFIGNKKIAVRAGCMREPDEVKEAVTLGYVFLGSTPIGIFALSDTCRAGAKEGIEELKSLGIKTAMLTGDSTAAALHAQKQLGNVIEEIHAELLPEGKVQIISNLKAKRGATVMVGDGMNDAPALAMATVGISMGISGSAIAMETSHATLMSNDIRRIPAGIRLARRAQRTIIENIVFSAVIKAAILGLAIGGHPLLWAAVLADVGTCLLVILNSLKLLRIEKKKESKKCCQRSNFQKSSCHGHCSIKIGTEEEEKSSSTCCGERTAGSTAQCCKEKSACRGNALHDEHSISMPCEEISHKHAGHEHKKPHSCEENSHKKHNQACHEHMKHGSREEEHSGGQSDHVHPHETESTHAHSCNHAMNAQWNCRDACFDHC